MTYEEKSDKHTIEYWLQFIKENNDDVADFNFGFSKIIEIAKQLEKENEQLKKQWHDCFLSCSSPYCAGHFQEVKCEGTLGNMSKREGEK